MAPSPSPPPLSPFPSTILRHLIHATSVTCRQNTTFARHGPPGALKKPRGDSFRVCERHPTHAEFQCTFARARAYSIPVCWICIVSSVRGEFALSMNASAASFTPQNLRFTIVLLLKERKKERETLEDDLFQPSKLTTNDRTVNYCSGNIFDRARLSTWNVERTRSFRDSHVIVSLATRRDADDENGESLRRGQAPFFARSPSRYDRGPPMLYIAEVCPWRGYARGFPDRQRGGPVRYLLRGCVPGRYYYLYHAHI